MKNKTPLPETSIADTAPTTITATQLARSLSDVLNRVRYQGERFVVQRNGEIIASLEPSEPSPRWGMPLHEFIEVFRNAPRPDDAFWDDLEEINRSQPPAEFREWPD